MTCLGFPYPLRGSPRLLMVLRNRSLTTRTDGGCILGLSGLHKSKQTREENKCHSVDRRSPVVFLLVCFNAHQTAALLATGVSPQKMLIYSKTDTSRITLFFKDPPFKPHSTPFRNISREVTSRIDPLVAETVVLRWTWLATRLVALQLTHPLKQSRQLISEILVD